MTIRNIYQDIYKHKTASIIKTDQKTCILNKILANIKPKNVLDIGCHDGSFLDLISHNANKHGIEANTRLAKICLKKGIKVKNIFLSDGEKLPYSKNKFDLVFIGEFIEHVFDTGNLLSEIHRVLAPGGSVLITTPNLASLGRRFMLLFGINPLTEYSITPDSAGHIRYFTFDTLNTLLLESGFKDIFMQSDTVNFDNSGKIKSDLLAELFPRLGRGIIALCKK